MQNRFIRYLVFSIFTFSFFYSCKKDTLDIPFYEVDSGTTLNLYKIFKLTDDTLFICGGTSRNGIVLRSVDGGVNWKKIASSLERCFYCISFVNSMKGFAGADSSFVYKTADGGFTWDLVMDYTGIPFQFKSPFRDCFFNDSLNGCFVGGKNFERGLIYATADGGQHWKTQGINHELRCITTHNTKVIAMGYGTHLMANSMHDDFTLLPSASVFYTAMAANNKNLFACSYDGDIFKSSDDGKSFFSLLKNKNIFSSSHYLCIDAADEKIICTGLGGITAISTNNGQSFNCNNSFNNTRINAIKFISRKKAIACGSNGKIFIIEW